MVPERRIAIVTGANTGVGYAIVQRLVQESPNPLTVILACRNKNRAQEALNSLEAYFAALQYHQQQKAEEGSTEKPGKDNNTPTIRHAPELKIELVDVGNVASVLAFNQRILDQYPRVDYLFCNAGVLPSVGLMWSKLVMDLFRAPMDLVVRSDVLIQPKQHLTEDGIGNVLACNVFGHYLMIKGLENLLDKTEEDPGRVIWTSSITAEKKSFNNDDWQGLEAEQPYESSKWVTDLLAIRLNEVWAGKSSGVSSGYTSSGSDSTRVNSNTNEVTARRVTRSASKTALGTSLNNAAVAPRRHIISIATQPGVVASGIGGLAAWIVMLRITLHYALRFFGERNQTITGYHGARSNVYVALKKADELDYRYKYGSCCKNLGQGYLKVEKVVEYEESQGKMIIEELEKVRLKFIPSS
ncbi:hypothetical protein EDD11_008636 [Mortierella claussenii]|nr:hypothetical protein EDD11_008636 [Mortierella claussenii]